MAKPTKSDLKKMTYQELQQHEADLQLIKQELRHEALMATKRDVMQLIKESGFELEELGLAPEKSERKRTRAKADSAPKFRHPENPALTWSGRGPRPKWLKEALEAGKSIDDFAI
ncbi:H-NS histone family protein [Litoreibacter roseus]|uniref:Histone-like nucleoid-structuring protein H-NS n=1 Tax=Litoreibacter roseus TaxID=2601869 RepID=A0A6N6JIA5_9RHOB|nr:H-NS histone family protein [Litoreibacter roseus]GFE65560.1 histone-like nucleoid-structuring protein H-NS [Litoreibacter roseus]